MQRSSGLEDVAFLQSTQGRKDKTMGEKGRGGEVVAADKGKCQS